VRGFILEILVTSLIYYGISCLAIEVASRTDYNGIRILNLELLSLSSLELVPVLQVPVIRVKVKGQAKCEGYIDAASKSVRLKYLCEDETAPGCTVTSNQNN
jgi:hypothetical protein